MIDIIPYREDKNLGKAYNEAFIDTTIYCPYLILRDYDTMWLLPDYLIHVDKYHHLYPDAVLTCFTNRISPLSKPQLYTGRISEVSDIKTHIKVAQKIQAFSGNLQGRYPVTEITQDISGMMMVVPRSVWREHNFTEDKLCLGVDTEWNRRIRKAGVKILRMDGIYIFHTYRLLNGVGDKSHLK